MSKAKFVHARGEKSHLKKNDFVKPDEACERYCKREQSSICSVQLYILSNE
ncbi:hypothetical protein [Prevotella disiens]|uniref:hypothetical protein n=1 Tax=Prevotella disiens TaxID=28130 RepID=UPI00336A5171